MPRNYKIISSVANPVRLQIIHALKDTELNVNQLIEICSLSQSAVSQHLAKLKKARLVKTRKSGKNVLYSLKYPDLSRIPDIIEEINNKIVDELGYENETLRPKDSEYPAGNNSNGDQIQTLRTESDDTEHPANTPAGQTNEPSGSSENNAAGHFTDTSAEKNINIETTPLPENNLPDQDQH